MTNTTTTTSPARTEDKVTEIDGYLELGMEEEALELIGVALAKQNISAEEFNTCVFALLQVQEPGKWRAAVETASGRLRKPVDDAIRANMLNYYFVIREPELAFQWFPDKGRTRFFDLWVMMQVCLDLSRLKEARKIARLCSRRMAATDSDFIKASMVDALTAYHMRIGDWEAALELWRKAPAEPAYERQRLCGMVKVHLHRALQTAKEGLARLAVNQLQVDLGSEVQAPGNTASLLNEAERELSELNEAIQRLV